MKGLSMTRDLEFALNWCEIIFVMDQDQLTHNYKIIPFNWMYSIPGSVSRKKEREEFLVVKSTPDTYMDQDEYDDEPRFDVKRFTSIEAYVNNLSRYLTGIYISDNAMKYTDINDPDIKFIMDHPKFLGFETEIKNRKK